MNTFRQQGKIGMLSISAIAFSGPVKADGLSDNLMTAGKVRTEYYANFGVGTNYPTLWYVNNGLPGAEVVNLMQPTRTRFLVARAEQACRRY